jgi:hypothetical protein
MSDHGKFITFPICWLSAPLPFDELLQKAISYGAYFFLQSSGDSLDEMRRQPDRHVANAGDTLGFSGGSLNNWAHTYNEVEKFTSAHERDHGKTFRIRVATALVFETIKGDGISERDFRVHCALLSMLGDKPFVRAGCPMIAPRAAGFLKGGPGLELPPLYSRGQIDRSLDYLRSRNLWRGYSYAGSGNKQPGIRYWTNRKSIEELVKMVHASKASRQASAAQQAEAVRIVDALRASDRGGVR